MLGLKLWNLFRHPATLKDLNVSELRTQLDQGSNIAVIDVRTAAEYRAGHIVEAKSYTMGKEQEIARDFSPSQPIVLICKTGHRSQAVAHELIALGFTDLAHLAGGMDAWWRNG